MIKKISISFLLLFSFCVGTSIAQRSAQATMRVSVRVISAITVETEQPDIVRIEHGIKSSLGMLTMKGYKKEDLLISTLSKMILRNKGGDKINLDLISRIEKKASGIKSIYYDGIGTGMKINQVYRGKLITTVEYL